MDKPKLKKIAKKIVVDLDKQTVVAFESMTGIDKLKTIHSCDCVSGDASHLTPIGLFKINRMHKQYRSKKYDVQMNYAMFFTTTGEALHQYHGPAPWWLLKLGRELTDSVGSHGCVRLQESDAKTLFEWVEIGTSVEVRMAKPKASK